MNQLKFEKRFGFSKIKYYLCSGKGERYKGLGEPFTRRPSGADFGRTPILFYFSNLIVYKISPSVSLVLNSIFFPLYSA